MSNGQLTQETIELIAALRPFTGYRGQKLIDTLIEISRSSSPGALDIQGLTIRAGELLSERLDSAMSLCLILAAAWLGTSFETASGADEPAQPAGRGSF